MKEEMLECPVDAFLGHYSPFLPDDVLVEAAKRALMEKQLLALNEENKLEQREFDEEPCKYYLEANVFKLLTFIAEVFDDGLEGLNGRQRRFSYRDCHNTQVKSGIGGSNFRTDACFTEEPDDTQNKYISTLKVAVVAEYKKHTRDYEEVSILLAPSPAFLTYLCRIARNWFPVPVTS
jgi:hypothetical protein